MESPSACRTTFSQAEDFAASVPGTSVVATPLSPALFSAELISLRLKELVLTVGRSTPLMFTGCLNTGSARIALPLERSDALRLNGLVIRPSHVAIFRPGESYDGAWSSDAHWASLTVPAAMLGPLLKVLPRSPLRRTGAHAVLRPSPEAWTRVASLIVAAKQVALEDPQVFMVAEALQGLRADLMEALRELVATTHQADAAKAYPSVAGRQHIVRAVENALRAYPGRVLSAEDLCAATGMMPSRLRAAIETSFGMEPEHYLRLRRLAMERIALRTDDRYSAALL
jgi:AraC-like DNA-binding protein